MIRIRILLPMLLAMGSPALLAGDLKRFELQPFGGFSASGSIPLMGDDGADHGSVHVSSTYNLGATFAVNLNPLDAVEASWQRQLTDGRLPTAIVVPQASGSTTDFDLRIGQYHCNFLHHYLSADPKAMPYVMAGLGATTYRASRAGWSGSRSYFSFSVGGGVKYFFTRNLGIRGEARWSPTLISASDSSFWCNVGGAGATCVVHLKASLQHQMDVTGGIIFRF